MKRFIYQLCLLTFLLGPMLASVRAQQAPTYEWAWAGGGSTTNSLVGGGSVAVDSVGNAYTVGGFGGTAIFEGHRFVCRSQRYNDLYLAKHNPQGRLLWIQQIGGPQIKDASGFTVDATGNIYLAGNFTDSITIGTTRLVGSIGTYDNNMFVAKFTPQGVLLWARQTTCAAWSGVYASDMAIDRAGNVYVAGSINGQVRFDQFSFTPSPFSAEEGFLARYTSQGVLQWVKTGYGPNKKTIAIGSDGALYMAGSFYVGLTFGSYTIQPRIGLNTPGLYLAKFDAQSNCLWVREGATDDGYAFGPECYGLAADPSSGGVVVSVLFGGPTTFGGRTFNCVGGCFPFSAAKDTGSDALILKFDAQGHLLWNAQLGGPLTAGQGGSGSFVVNPSDIPGRASVDARGNVYVLLQLFGMPTITTSSSSPSDRIFYTHLVAYSPAGRLRWTRPMPSTISSGTSCVVWSSTGYLYASGSTYGPAQFDNLTLPVTGVYNAFTAKLTNPPGADDGNDLANLVIPTIITPNGDQQNEAFYLLGLPLGIWQLTIYSRWGARVYHSDDYKQDWNAPGLPDGQYYYHLQAPNRPALKGWLEVIH